MNPYDSDNKLHEEALERLAISLFRAGRIRFPLALQDEESKIEQQFVDFSKSDLTDDQIERVLATLRTTGMKHEVWKRFGF